MPAFVKSELNVWIGHIQNPVDGDADDGGSGYTMNWDWVNTLKTGNLLQQMALVGSGLTDARVQDALDYLARHWADPNPDPGWRAGWSSTNYQATFTIMKGLTSFGLYDEFGDPPIFWQDDFEAIIPAEQIPVSPTMGYWDNCEWGWDPVLCTTWALLTLQKAAPPPPEIKKPVDIKPMSCPNPLNVGERGVIPAAFLGTADFDVTQIDPASVVMQVAGASSPTGVSPLRWSIEDVAAPFVPASGQEIDRYFCADAGPDGFADLTLKYDAQEVVAAIEATLGAPPNDGDVVQVELAGTLKAEFGGLPVEGTDVLWIRRKGK